MAYAGSKRLYISESPMLADDTNYQFVSSDVDDDTETARVNAMQAAYQAMLLRRSGGYDSGQPKADGDDEDELEAEARYQDALRERLGKPSAPAPVAVNRYGVPKLDLRDSVDESRNYDEYAAVEDSLDFDITPRAEDYAAYEPKWRDPPPNPFDQPPAPPHGSHKPAATSGSQYAAAAKPFHLKQTERERSGHFLPAKQANPAFEALNYQLSLQPVHQQPQPYYSSAGDWDYQQPQRDSAHSSPGSDATAAKQPPQPATRDCGVRPQQREQNPRSHQSESVSLSKSEASENKERPAGATSAPAAGAGIRHLPPKPSRPATNFVELNKGKSLAKDIPKGSYVERIIKKKEVSEMLKEFAPGMRMPKKKAASADDVTTGQQPNPHEGAALDEARAADLWKQKASGLATKGLKNAVPAAESKLYRRSSDSSINRPHFVQPLASKDYAAEGAAVLSATNVGMTAAEGPLRPSEVRFNDRPIDRSQYPQVELRQPIYQEGPQLPPLAFYPPPFAPGYNGFVHPAYAGFVPYHAAGYSFHPAFHPPHQATAPPYPVSATHPPGLTHEQPHAGPNVQGFPYGADYHSMPELDARSAGKPESPPGRPPWSTDVPRLSHTHPEPSGRLNHYATVPPITAAPGDGSYSQQYAQLREKEKRRIDNPAYTAYTLSDYKKLEKEIKLGGLGPSLDPSTLREKNERRLRQLQYAKQVVDQQRVASLTQKPPRQLPAEDVREEQQDPGDVPANRRQAAIDYARSVPKPKLKVTTKNDSPAPPATGHASDPTVSKFPVDRGQTPVAALTPLSKVADFDLEMLHQRHQMEKMAVLELRKNTRAAV